MSIASRDADRAAKYAARTTYLSTSAIMKTFCPIRRQMRYIYHYPTRSTLTGRFVRCKSGKHVLCEKPLTDQVGEAEQAFEVAERPTGSCSKVICTGTTRRPKVGRDGSSLGPSATFEWFAHVSGGLCLLKLTFG